MAPPRTMVAQCPQPMQPVGQKNPVADQIQHHTNGTSKSRRRNKTKQANLTQTNNETQNKVAEKSDIKIEEASVPRPKTQDLSLKTTVTAPTQPANQVVPSEGVNVKKLQQLQNNVPTKLVETHNGFSKKNIVSCEGTKGSVLAKQISNEETDDIDAGIELDGSSYSGSSVKDISEDQIKSASVSPVMAQSNLVNETSPKHAADVSSIEQLAGSLCSMPMRRASTTKQELANIQQVIDADEQMLQLKLKNKQMKKSTCQENSPPPDVAHGLPPSNTDQILSNDSDSIKTTPSNLTKDLSSDKFTRPKRKFSTQSSQEAQDSSVCKICVQHVYQMERLMAEKALYHKRCFRCFQCKIQLRMDNYSSHEGEVYCRAHHRQLLQPQVKLDNDDDVEIVAKSKIRKRQMIICENEPAELPKDVVRSETKVDDGFQQLNINLNNIMEKFEKGTTSGEESQSSSASIMLDKPSFNIKSTLKAFESKLSSEEDALSESRRNNERRAVKKLANLDNFFMKSMDKSDEESKSAIEKPLVVRRSESLMNRLKKYELRIAGEHVKDDDEDDDQDNIDTNNKESALINKLKPSIGSAKQVVFPKRISLSSLKTQWENGDINSKRNDDNLDENDNIQDSSDLGNSVRSPLEEKHDELNRIRQQLARRKSGEKTSIKNIYENAIKEAQQSTSKQNSNDLSALNGFSTSLVQRQLLQNSQNSQDNNDAERRGSNSSELYKEQFQLNLTNKANKLKEKFELGLINNTSHDDSDLSDTQDSPALSKMEQLRQEKLEDLSVFTDGEIKAREARSMFQQIDKRLSSSSSTSSPNVKPAIASRSSLQSRNRSFFDNTANNSSTTITSNQPIRLTNNVRT